MTKSSIAYNPAHVLAVYAEHFQVRRWESPPQGRGFSGALVFRVETNQGAYCLRGWPPRALPKDRIVGLHRLLGHIFARGVRQVPVPVALSTGSTVLTHDGRFWQLEPWMPGQADYHANPTPERLRSAMTALAAWHNAAASFAPHPAEAHWFDSHPHAASPAVIERQEKIGHWLRADCRRLHEKLEHASAGAFKQSAARFLHLFERLAPRVADGLLAASRQQYRLHPCLRDIWHDHVLFTGNEVTGLVDASACRTDHVAADLSRLLGSLVGNDGAGWDLALDEYAKHRPLVPDELDLVRILDKSSFLLSGMSWLRRYYLENEQLDDLPRVQARLDGFLARAEFLNARWL